MLTKRIHPLSRVLLNTSLSSLDGISFACSSTLLLPTRSLVRCFLWGLVLSLRLLPRLSLTLPRLLSEPLLPSPPPRTRAVGLSSLRMEVASLVPLCCSPLSLPVSDGMLKVISKPSNFRTCLETFEMINARVPRSSRSPGFPGYCATGRSIESLWPRHAGSPQRYVF